MTTAGCRRRLALAVALLMPATLVGEEFSNSFAIDLGRKSYRIAVTGDGQRADLDGTYTTAVHATWMLRLWDHGFESPGFLGGLGLAYGLYDDRDLTLQVFECRGDFGPAFEPVPWLRLGMLLFGGVGYHDLHLPRAVYDLTTIGGAGMWGFTYGAHAQLTFKPCDSLHLSGQFGFRGLYASYGVFEDDQLTRGVSSSAIGLLAGASIDFAF
jgi:hypothetical protein